MKRLLFFDCETNGLPIDYKASYENINNWPRVLSLCWALTDEQGNVLEEKYFLIKPDGWMVPTEEFWVKNGYSQEKSMAEGVPIKDVLQQFLAAKQQADYLIAHNLNFDHRVVWAEFLRNGMEPRRGLVKFCTMQKTTTYCKIPHAKGGRGYKWPTLTELHNVLFKKDFDGAHDASADVRALRACFFELKKIGFITLPEVAQPDAQTAL